LRGGWSAEDLHCHVPSMSRLVLGCYSGAGCTVFTSRPRFALPELGREGMTW
jgi:hypothetical protein